MFCPVCRYAVICIPKIVHCLARGCEDLFNRKDTKGLLTDYVRMGPGPGGTPIFEGTICKALKTPSFSPLLTQRLLNLMFCYPKASCFLSFWLKTTNLSIKDAILWHFWSKSANLFLKMTAWLIFRHPKDVSKEAQLTPGQLTLPYSVDERLGFVISWICVFFTRSINVFDAQHDPVTRCGKSINLGFHID